MELFPFYFLWSWVLLTSTQRHKEIQVLQEMQSDGTWNIKAFLLTRHKITFLQIILWKAGRGKTPKEIPSSELLGLWKWQGQVSCRAVFCCSECCSFAGWVRVCAGAVLVLTGACQCHCAPAAASQGIRAGGTKGSHSNLSPLLVLNTSCLSVKTGSYWEGLTLVSSHTAERTVMW